MDGTVEYLTRLLGERFEILQALGEGGMCQVYQGRSRSDGSLVALKVLRPELATDANERERIVREAAAGQALRHRNVVAVHEVVTTGPRPVIVMEYVDGETLSVAAAGLGADRILLLLAEVADALTAAHRRGLLHRDLKPENVLVTAEGAAKVADWGLARSSRDEGHLTKTGIVVGTPQYMAPEQILQGDLTPATDLYALGCMAHELLGGRRPFDGPNAVDVLRAQLSTPPPALRGVSPAIADLVERLLRKDASERPSGAAEVARKLRSLARGSAVPSRPSGPESGMHATIPPSPRPREPRGPASRTTALVAGAAAVVLAVALGLFLARRGGSGPEAEPPPEVLAPALTRLDEVRIRFRGRPTAPLPWRLLQLDGEAELAPGGTLDPAGATQVTRERWEVPLVLPRALVTPGRLVLLAPGTSPATFPLDPGPRLEEVLAPVDALRRERVQPGLDEVAVVSVERSSGRIAAADAMAEIERILDEAGLDGAHLQELDLLLAELPRVGTIPSSPLAARLMPLRLVEAYLARAGLDIPWPKIQTALGVRHELRASLPPPDPGFVTLVERELRAPAPPDRNGRPRLIYPWVVSPRFQRSVSSDNAAALSFATSQYLFVAPGEDRPEPRLMPTSVVVNLPLAPPPDRTWPPTAVRVHVQGTSPGDQTIALSFNAAPPARVLRLRPVNAVHVNVSFPLDPAQLQPGTAILDVTTDDLPLRNPSDQPLKLQTVRIDARW